MLDYQLIVLLVKVARTTLKIPSQYETYTWGYTWHPLACYPFIDIKLAAYHLLLYVVYLCQKSQNFVYALICYKQKCKVVSLNLAHPVYGGGGYTLHIWSCIGPRLERLLDRTSRDVVLNVSSQSRLGLVAMTSRLETITPMSPSRLGLGVIHLVYNPGVSEINKINEWYHLTANNYLNSHLLICL